MDHGYAGWKSALAMAVVTVGVGCGGDGEAAPETGSTGTSGSAAATSTTTAGGTTGSTASTSGSTTDTTGTSGTTGTTAGTTGTSATGTSSTGTSSTGGSSGSNGNTGASTGGTANNTGTTGATTGSTADAGADTGGGDAGTTTGDMMSAACVPAMANEGDSADGPFTPTHIEDTGPGGASWLVYPQELGMGGMLHPVFNWGPGAGTQPEAYRDHLYKLASHGFVVVSQASNRSEEVEALDWVLAKNDDPDSEFYQQLDPDRVGMGGHSMGSFRTMNNAADPRLNLYVLVCGGCGNCGASDIHGPTVILGATGDFATSGYDQDYEQITSPVVFVNKTGSGHIECARDNLEPWVAFMRWQWCGEDQWAPDFQSGGKYCSSGWEECRSKNF